MKKNLSIVLILVVAFGLFNPISAYAKSGPTIEQLYGKMMNSISKYNFVSFTRDIERVNEHGETLIKHKYKFDLKKYTLNIDVVAYDVDKNKKKKVFAFKYKCSWNRSNWERNKTSYHTTYLKNSIYSPIVSDVVAALDSKIDYLPPYSMYILWNTYIDGTSLYPLKDDKVKAVTDPQYPEFWNWEGRYDAYDYNAETGWAITYISFYANKKTYVPDEICIERKNFDNNTSSIVTVYNIVYKK